MEKWDSIMICGYVGWLEHSNGKLRRWDGETCRRWQNNGGTRFVQYFLIFYKCNWMNYLRAIAYQIHCKSCTRPIICVSFKIFKEKAMYSFGYEHIYKSSCFFHCNNSKLRNSFIIISFIFVWLNLHHPTFIQESRHKMKKTTLNISFVSSPFSFYFTWNHVHSKDHEWT